MAGATTYKRGWGERLFGIHISSNLPAGTFKGLVKIAEIIVCSNLSTFLKFIKITSKGVIISFIIIKVVSKMINYLKARMVLRWFSARRGLVRDMDLIDNDVRKSKLVIRPPKPGEPSGCQAYQVCHE